MLGHDHISNLTKCVSARTTERSKVIFSGPAVSNVLETDGTMEVDSLIGISTSNGTTM